MPVIEPSAPLRLLRAGYAPDDWVAVFLKSYATGETCQRVAPISQVSRPEFLAWLRSRNASAWNVYVSVNGVSPQSRSRSRQSVAAIRHVFLEADEDGPAGTGENRRTRRSAAAVVPAALVPTPRPRVLARHRIRHPARGGAPEAARPRAEDRHRGDILLAAHAIARAVQSQEAPSGARDDGVRRRRSGLWPGRLSGSQNASRTDCRRSVEHNVPADWRLERARRYLAALPPAIAGSHGDLHTFRVCCRLVRGFALDDGEALALLQEWNASLLSRRGPIASWNRRSPSARRYGREPIGGLLEVRR